ncbi:MAG: twin-arginine translocation signal domain-containing protein [Bacillota bacterium]|nr:MAG: formate dehydrogenase [Bacillota bacterium]
MNLSRRQFLQLAGVSAAATAATLFLDEEPALASDLQEIRISKAREVPSVCPHCSVGCGLIAYVKDDQLLQVEGNPDSPINEGSLCPKGAATFQFAYEALGKPNPRRELKAKYRAPYSDRWEEISIDEALDRIAQRVKETRDRYFIEEKNGVTVNRLEAIAHIGSAVIDNEENYLLTKLMRSLGVVFLEHHARI